MKLLFAVLADALPALRAAARAHSQDDDEGAITEYHRGLLEGAAAALGVTPDELVRSLELH